MYKLEQSDREKALILMNHGASYQEVQAKLGVKIGTLRSWKARYMKETELPKSKAKPKAAVKPLRPSKPKAAISEAVSETVNETDKVKIQSLQLVNALVVADNDAMQQALTALEVQHETMKVQCVALQEQSAVLPQLEGSASEVSEPYNLPLILAVVALHFSAVYGVGEILSEVFHTYVMGYLTAAVFVSAGLIMFASNKFAVGVSWVVLVATFLLESYCNYLTIYMKMEAEQLAVFQQHTNTSVLFFCIAVFVPLVNLALEYLLFKPLVKA